jgi:YD repeat-containing protein
VDDHPYEEFRTRKVIADENFSRGDGYAIGFIITLGTSELIEVPYQLFLLTKRTVLGQTIRVTYDKYGNIAYVTRDGQTISSFVRNLERSAEKESGDVQPASATTVPGPSAAP